MRVVTRLPYKTVMVELPAPVYGPGHTLIIKSSFDLVAGSALQPLAAARQFEMNGDVPFMDEMGRSLEAPTDLMPLKRRGEVVVTADAHAPGGVPVTQLDVGFSVGRVHKQLRVFGDRAWVAGPGDSLVVQGPLPFTVLPIRYERAFGGLASAANPMGRGMEPWPEADGRSVFYLANIEHPGMPVTRLSDHPPPAGFGPIHPMWEPRRRRAGTQDLRWATFRAPLPPVDFEPLHYNAAPEDQWIPDYWRGDEPIRLHNLDPEHPDFVSGLPGLRIRAFVHRHVPSATEPGATTEEFVEIGLSCDTVHINVPKRLATMVWRGHYMSMLPKGAEVAAIYVAEELLSTPPARLDVHFDEYRRLVEPPPIEAPRPVPPPADPEPPEFAAAMADAMKVLRDSGVDPAVIAGIEAAGSPEAQLDIIFGALDSVMAEMEQIIAGLPVTRR